MKQKFVRNWVAEGRDSRVSEQSNTIKTKNLYAGEFAPKEVIIKC